MSALSNVVGFPKGYIAGAGSAFAAPLAGITGSVIALNGVTTGSTTSTAGLVLFTDKAFNIEFGSLAAIVQAGVTTLSLVVTPQWQVSEDGSNWMNLFDVNCTANVAYATGTGSLVTTQDIVAFRAINPAFPFVRFSVLSTGATGAAGDNVTVAYQWRRRYVAAVG